VRVLTVLKWKSSFEDFAYKFARDKEGIAYDLQLHTQAAMVNAEESLERIEKRMQNMMNLVFNDLCSPEEKAFEDFIQSRGGPESVVEKDSHLSELLAMESHNKHHWDIRVKHAQRQDTESLLARAREQFRKSVTQVIEENAKVFAQKFEAQMEQILHTQNIIVRESDRVIKTVLTGPHERLLDPVGIVYASGVTCICSSFLGHVHRLERNGKACLYRDLVEFTDCFSRGGKETSRPVTSSWH
jgi:hypothetical protein